MNAKRPLPHSAQFCQNLLLFADHRVSSVTGAFRRMTRASTNIIGTWNRFQKGHGFRGFLHPAFRPGSEWPSRSHPGDRPVRQPTTAL